MGKLFGPTLTLLLSRPTTFHVIGSMVKMASAWARSGDPKMSQPRSRVSAEERRNWNKVFVFKIIKSTRLKIGGKSSPIIFIFKLWTICCKQVARPKPRGQLRRKWPPAPGTSSACDSHKLTSMFVVQISTGANGFQQIITADSPPAKSVGKAHR